LFEQKIAQAKAEASVASTRSQELEGKLAEAEARARQAEAKVQTA